MGLTALHMSEERISERGALLMAHSNVTNERAERRGEGEKSSSTCGIMSV